MAENLERAKEDDDFSATPKYEVSFADWKGPYDVLLDVIHERELNLLDLDIASLLEGYLEYIEKSELINIDEAGEFLVVAATLAQIKSKLLLPKEEQEPEEEEKDPRADLVRYLMEYKKIKQVADQLRERPLLGRDVFMKGAREVFEGIEGEGHGTLFQLVKGFQKVLKDLKSEVPMEFEREEVSVSERFHEIFNILKTQGKATFLEVIGERRTKNWIIVTFLCLLELVRLKKMKVVQKDADLPMILEFMEGAEDDLDHSEFDGVVPAVDTTNEATA